jgi:thiazole synthase ThiGH ThiG subunit
MAWKHERRLKPQEPLSSRSQIATSIQRSTRIAPGFHRCGSILFAAEHCGLLHRRGAVRTAHLARDVGMSDWFKVEVIGNKCRLDLAGTPLATKLLVKDGFTVLAHSSDDIIFAERLIDVGSAAIMPLGAPIGSSLQNRTCLQIMRDMIHKVPLIVDAGDSHRVGCHIGYGDGV